MEMLKNVKKGDLFRLNNTENAPEIGRAHV